jgi:anhydro-N-acetylmuramic acid kinase
VGELYIGLMSGTSLDGVDAAVVEFDDHRCTVRAAATTAFPKALRARLETLIDGASTGLVELGALDSALGEVFAGCVLALLEEARLETRHIAAIGHHGQTVYHRPSGPEPFTLQIGDPNVIAARTGITVVADLRRLDVALGGQGAPLMPCFHAWCFADPEERRGVVNIGGIANVSMLRPGLALSGFDTGPGNTLLDGWIARRRRRRFDRNGEFAAAGNVDEHLLSQLLSDPFFALAPPKSTGREYFNLQWLESRLAPFEISDQDVQATLAELTAVTIADALCAAEEFPRVILCGGGAYNLDLVTRLQRNLAPATVVSSRDYGIAPDWVEAAGCAWFARARLRQEPVSEPSVTGARQAAVLGGVYLGVTKNPP